MRNDRFRNAVAVLSVSLLTIGPGVNPLLSQTPTVTGRIAGNVYDHASGLPVEGARVEALQVTTNEVFTSPASDPLGGYLIPSAPPGIYAVRISHDGVSYEVAERFDVRTGIAFLLEACFVLDRENGSASLRADCSSGLYAERQVVSLGAHRFFDPDPGASPASDMAQPSQTLTITHAGLGCITSDVFPQVDADIFRDIDVAVARAFFRSADYPDFYSIDLESTGTGFRGIFPRPAPETTQVVYYVEAVDTGFNPVQTQEFFAPVLPVEECRDLDPAATFFTGNDPGITVTATRAGAAPQPPGFLPLGIVSFISASGTVTTAFATGAAAGAGGGLSTLGLVLIVGGAAV
ncbi:MAG: carboxypeptidase-like regulatory domain-containing protein, partial [Acidobacteriota bacterium]|nr:carboxypeptidase-like regulatory domain-containing protein [Acidobacteriota bacterium]